MSQAKLTSKRYFEIENEKKTCLQILQDPDAPLDPFKIQTPESATPPNVVDLAETLVSRRSGAQVDIVPSTLDLMYVALGTATGDIEVLEARFKAFVDDCRNHYDLTMIDCHPAGSILTRTSLQNSDHVLIPVVPQAYAARGIALMMRFISANSTEPNKPMPHILFNMVPRSGPTPTVVNEIRGNPNLSQYCLKRVLRKYKAYSDPTEGRGFVWTSGKSYSVEAFGNLFHLAHEFAERIEL